MPWVFNPFTGNLDFTSSSSGGGVTSVDGLTGVVVLSSIYQAKENQSLSTTNDVQFNQVTSPTVKASSSAGLTVHNSSGADVALFGAGGGQNATFYDGVKLNGSTANRVLTTDTNKNITASTVTDTDLLNFLTQAQILARGLGA